MIIMIIMIIGIGIGIGIVILLIIMIVIERNVATVIVEALWARQRRGSGLRARGSSYYTRQ